MFDIWKLKDFAPGEGVAVSAFDMHFDEEGWIDVTAPGDVHQALILAGRLQDPFYDRNELDCAWIEEREWWYRQQIENTLEPLEKDERLQLVFHGLDTFATIWLNGQELGRHNNMFHEAVFDVSQRWHTNQPNVLAICFDRPANYTGELNLESWGGCSERVRLRKAQFGYGWDWGPRLPTIGIWRPIELRRQQRVSIQGLHFSTIAIEHKEQQAFVTVQVDIEQFANTEPLELAIELATDDKYFNETTVLRHTYNVQSEERLLSSKVSLIVDQPRLWWTHDLGIPALYSLRVRLNQNGKELTRQQRQVGIRTLELDQSPDTAEQGTRFFRFILNAQPIFVRGANWIPAHSFVGAITKDRYEMLLTNARAANMNMLRVWGGGIYEHDAFYELCDQLGILIWQDFMFACAMYPEEDPTFVAEVEIEARYQVARLRNHASLALWCGNNENQWIYEQTHWDRPNDMVSGSLYYNTILPGVVKELDGRTPYWPGSPYGGNNHNSMEDGDTHNWQVWHGTMPKRFGEPTRVDQSPEGVSFLHYAEDMGRFISEFGMHASPVYETLRRNIPADQLYHHSLAMDHHNKDNPKNKGDNLMLTVTGLPGSLEEYIDYSMIAQAEGLKWGIEHFRRRKPHCSGTLIWQFNDCWPVLSWSILDYYGFGKAGYYYVRRVYAPLLASFQLLENGEYELWITNDTLQDVEDTISVRLATFAKGMLWEKSRRVQIKANSSQVVWRWQREEISGSPDRYLAVSSASAAFPPNRHFFAAIKDLQRTAIAPQVEIRSHNKHELHVSIQAATYLYFVHLTTSDEHTCFSDNYFDLEACESRTITVSNTTKILTPEMISIGWR